MNTSLIQLLQDKQVSNQLRISNIPVTLRWKGRGTVSFLVQWYYDYVLPLFCTKDIIVMNMESITQTTTEDLNYAAKVQLGLGLKQRSCMPGPVFHSHNAATACHPPFLCWCYETVAVITVETATDEDKTGRVKMRIWYIHNRWVASHCKLNSTAHYQVSSTLLSSPPPPHRFMKIQHRHADDVAVGNNGSLERFIISMLMVWRRGGRIQRPKGFAKLAHFLWDTHREAKKNCLSVCLRNLPRPLLFSLSLCVALTRLLICTISRCRVVLVKSPPPDQQAKGKEKERSMSP